MLENQGYSQVFSAGGAISCSSSGMPNLCVLAAANGVASHFYANTHGSLLSYLFNTSGADWKGKPWDCTGSACASAGVIKGDNIVRALNNAHKTWRGYFEGMPICGYMGGSSGNYTAHHDPFKWYSDVADSTNDQQGNMCPFTQLAVDLGQNALPNFGYIVPNLRDDAEGTGTQSASALLSTADKWIKTNIGPGPGTLLSSAPFQPGGDGILIVTFDESRVEGKSGDKSSDDACSPTKSSGCGGHVAFVMIGPNVIVGSTASATYHFQDMLHTILHLLGISDYMNGANGAADIALLPGA
jgi:acid phosphatase